MATPTIRFELRPDKKDDKGFQPLRLVYQIKGQRKYFAAGIKLQDRNWQADNQRAIYLDKKAAKKLIPDVDYDLLPMDADIKDYNAKLDEIRRDLKDIEKRFELDKVSYSSQMVIDELNKIRKPLTKKEEPGIYVYDFIEKYAKDSGTTHRKSTIATYEGLAKRFNAYQKATGQRVTFQGIDINFIKGFQTFLSQLTKEIKKDERVTEIKLAMNNTSIAKQISILKTILNQARVLYKLPVNNDYRDFKFGRKDGRHEVIVLTEEELQAVINLDLTKNRGLDRVRDVFVFSCATGLRFSDLVQLRREHIRGDMIKMSAVKTGQKLDIPLNAISSKILDKYKEMAFPLPIISSQKTNVALKKIGQQAGISTPIEKVREFGAQRKSAVLPKYELMSIHMGRRTFATLSLEKGMAPQEVMAITGHTTYSSFKRYVDVSTERKKTVIHKAWGAPEIILKAV